MIWKNDQKDFVNSPLRCIRPPSGSHCACFWNLWRILIWDTREPHFDVSEIQPMLWNGLPDLRCPLGLKISHNWNIKFKWIFYCVWWITFNNLFMHLIIKPIHYRRSLMIIVSIASTRKDEMNSMVIIPISTRNGVDEEGKFNASFWHCLKHFQWNNSTDGILVLVSLSPDSRQFCERKSFKFLCFLHSDLLLCLSRNSCSQWNR